MTFIQAMTIATVAVIMAAAIVSGYGWMLAESIFTTKEFFFCATATGVLTIFGITKYIEMHVNRVG